jgi:hypothetical protein
MTVSGSSDFNRTRNQIIARSGRIVGAVRAGATLGAQEVLDFSEALNAMVKRWQATPNMRVWTVTEGTLFPQASQSRYALGSASTDHATESYVTTNLSAAASSGATTISVDSITGFSSGQYIGVVLSSGALYWTTINGAPSGSAITLTAGLSGAASDNAAVFAYTTKLVRPLKIVDARRYSIASGTEATISEYQGGLMARLDYRNLPNKSQTGSIIRAHYDPQREGLGYLYLWQPPSTVLDLVNFTWHRPVMDFDAAGDTPDLPAEWIDPLVWNLALEMATEYKVSDATYNRIAQQAVKYLDDVAGFDREPESIVFSLDAMG